jgi:hypothetical protein
LSPLIYAIGLIVVLAALGVCMSISIKKYDKKMASQKKKKRRR